MIIDVYNHILPRKYQDTLEKKLTSRDPKLPSSRWAKTVTTLAGLEARLRIMDAFDGYIQVISVASPATYAIAPAPVAINAGEESTQGVSLLLCPPRQQRIGSAVR